MNNTPAITNLAEMFNGPSAAYPDPEEGGLMSGLTEMLQAGSSSTGNDVIFRRGTTDDVLPADPVPEKKYWEPESDGNT